jgi:hypothetical protein
MGIMGAALTLGDKSAGAFKGGFHGMAGGAFWAIGISTALLLYWVTLRGNLVARKGRDWAPAGLVAGLGGFVAGVALSFVLGFVFQNDSLYYAGWLCTASQPNLPGKLGNMFLLTRHGWITPIFGFAVAVGISWTLQRVTNDPKIEEFRKSNPRAIHEPNQVFRSIRRILELVTFKSWRLVIAVSLGGLAVFGVIRPGPGVCDNGPRTLEQGRQYCSSLHLPPAMMQGCKVSDHPALAPVEARVAGMVFIICIGGLFLQVGLLFGIFAARVGVQLDRDEHFLEPLPLPATAAATAGS